jgi:hypothetical protein
MVRNVEIGCHQVMLQDASVWSVQTLDVPPPHAGRLTPATLFDLYLDHIRRFTLGIIRPMRRHDGLDFTLLGSSCSLISFTPPEETATTLCIRICGGLLVQRDQCHRGELTFATESAADGGSRVSLTLSDYCPLLLGSSRPSWGRKWLYRLTQAALHKVVTIRFLARAYRQLCDPGAAIRVVRLPAMEGEDI